MNPELEIVVVEDHHALRTGLELLLTRESMRVIGSTSTAREGFELVKRRKPDVALIDIELEQGNGLALTRRVLADDPQARVLLYTGLEDPELLGDALASGARGLAHKTCKPRELIDGIEQIAAGGSFIDVRTQVALEARAKAPRNLLTARECEVLGLLAQGYTSEQTADHLLLSSETIRTHVRNAMNKLGARTRLHALALAVQQGEISL